MPKKKNGRNERKVPEKLPKKIRKILKIDIADVINYSEASLHLHFVQRRKLFDEKFSNERNERKVPEKFEKLS